MLNCTLTKSAFLHCHLAFLPAFATIRGNNRKRQDDDGDIFAPCAILHVITVGFGNFEGLVKNLHFFCNLKRPNAIVAVVLCPAVRPSLAGPALPPSRLIEEANFVPGLTRSTISFTSQPLVIVVIGQKQQMMHVPMITRAHTMLSKQVLSHVFDKLENDNK